MLKTLDCCQWPALPIFVQYGGSLALDAPAPEDEENIMTKVERILGIRVIGCHLQDLHATGLLHRPGNDISPE